jgi:hypothetical protein
MGTMARSIRCAFASAHNAPSPPAIGLLPIIDGSEPLMRPAFLAGLEMAVMAEHHHFSPRRKINQRQAKGFHSRIRFDETPRAVWLGVCARRNGVTLDSLGPAEPVMRR